MSILEISLIFVIFCVVWFITSYFWKIVEGKIMLKRQDQMMDAAYAKFVRILLKAVKDYKSIKEVINRDQM